MNYSCLYVDRNTVTERAALLTCPGRVQISGAVVTGVSQLPSPFPYLAPHLPLQGCPCMQCLRLPSRGAAKWSWGLSCPSLLWGVIILVWGLPPAKPSREKPASG